MSEWKAICTMAELETLDDDEIVAGYREFERGDPEPGNNRSRSYWHGWCNAARDAGELPYSPDAAQLAHEYIERRRAH